MLTDLPKTPKELLGWDWARFEPLARELAQRPLDSVTVGEWLQDWSDLDSALVELYNRLYLATSMNTADSAAESAYARYVDEIFPRSLEADQALKRKLLDSQLEPAGLELALRNMRAEAALFREANLPLLSQEHRLGNEYDKINGAQTVTWEGQECTITQLRQVFQDLNRERREEAWRLRSARQLADRAALDDLWVRFLYVRRQLAANAGLPDYRTYRWQQLLRFDYSPQDCRRFTAGIEKVVVPATSRAYERRRRRLGIEKLRPWDLDVDRFALPPLRPYRAAGELTARVTTILRQVSPQLGGYFDQMVAEGLLDLENRKNKAPGGYCTDFLMMRRPFIFMNAVGLNDDVMTLLHEAGHAFHTFETAGLRLIMQLQAPMEFAEVASTGMEFLASPYLEERLGGFYSAQDAARARAEHLEFLLLFLPYMAVVDEFQQWAYTRPEEAARPTNCDAAWAGLWQRFMPGVDWSGLEEEMATGWQRKLHIFVTPFYYVEYGLAQLGAAQIWRNALRDQASAVARYRQALALGGTRSLPLLYQAAGARLAFDAETIGEVVDLVEDKIAELDTLV